LGPFGDALDLGRVYVNVSFGNDDTKVFNVSLVKGTFLWLEVEVVFGKASKYFMRECVEVLEVTVKQEDVVKVDNEVAFIDEVMEDVVHKSLESCRGIAESKCHDKGFKKS